MAYFQLQLSTAAFLTAQLRTAQAQPQCLPLTGEVQIQRITFDASELRHAEPDTFTVLYRDSGKNPDPPHLAPTPYPAKGFKAQLAQDVTVEFALAGAIHSTPNQLVAPVYACSLTIVLALELYPALFGNCAFHRRFEAVEWPPLPPLPPGLGIDVDDLKAQLETEIRARVAGPATLFDVSSLLPPGSDQMVNAGVAIDASGQRISFRMDPAPGTSGNDLAWTAFFSGATPDHLQGHDWSIFIQGLTLAGLFDRLLGAAISEAGIDGSPARLSSYGSTYHLVGGTPRVTTWLHLFVDVPVVGETYVPIDLNTDFSVDNGRLVADFHATGVERLLDAFQSFLNALKAYAPFVWFLVDWLAGDDLAKLPGALDFDPPSAGGFTAEKVSPTHIRFSRPLPAPGVPGVRLRATDVVGLPDGLAIAGALVDRPYTPSEPTVMPGRFVWVAPSFSCGQASERLLDAAQEDPESVAHLYAEIVLGTTGEAPIYVCGAPEVIEDPQHVYPTAPPALSVDRTLLPCRIAIRLDRMPAAHYDLQLRVRTTAGVMVVRLPPPEPMTEADKARIVSTVKIGLQRCDVLLGPWFDGARQFDVSWIVDPLLDPDPQYVDANVWTFEVQGLAGGEAVDVAADAVGTLAQGVAAAGAPLSLVAIAPPLQTLSLQRSNGRLPARGRRGVEVRRRPLLKAGSILLAAPALDVFPAAVDAVRVLAVALPDAVQAHSVSNPYLPARVAEWAAPGTAGAIAWPGGLLAFGEDGLLALGPGGRRERVGDCAPSGVLDVARGPRAVYVLRDGAVEVRTRELCPESTLAAEGMSRLRLSGRTLLAGGPGGIAAFDVGDPFAPRRVARLGLALERFARGTLADGAVVAILPDGSAVPIALHGSELVAGARTVRPWQDEWLPVGRGFAKLSEDRRRVALSTLGAERLVVPEREREALTA